MNELKARQPEQINHAKVYFVGRSWLEIAPLQMQDIRSAKWLVIHVAPVMGILRVILCLQDDVISQKFYLLEGCQIAILNMVTILQKKELATSGGFFFKAVSKISQFSFLHFHYCSFMLQWTKLNLAIFENTVSIVDANKLIYSTLSNIVSF